MERGNEGSLALLRIIAAIGAVWWIAAIATFAASLFGAVLQPRIQRRRATGSDRPPLSLILPVKLVNPGFERAQASAFDQDYPAYEVIVGAMEAESPAVARMRDFVASSPVPARLVRGAPMGAVSPKLDTLVAPLDGAAHDLVVTKDSNITFAPDTLRAMVRGLTPSVGLVCAVPVAVRAETMAGHVEAILINRDARLLLTASAAGKGYGVGKVMVFRRGDLARAGGVAALAYTIAEDTALSRALGAIGLRTVFADRTVDQEIGARTFRDVYARQARWAVIRRAEEPSTFAFEPVACPLPAALAGAIAAPLVGFAAPVGFGLTLGGWYLLEVLTTALKGWELRPWTPAAFIGRDLVLLVAWARAWTTRTVVWAGRTQDVRDVLRKSWR
jgi:ceramide glucosyltransferase